MVIYILLATLLALMILCYIIFKQDIMAPPFIMCASFSISVLCCIYNVDSWAVDLHWNTYGVIIGGLATFIVSSFLVYLYNNKKERLCAKTNEEEISAIEMKPVDVSKLFYGCFLLFSIIISLLFFMEVMRIADIYGDGSSWVERIGTYRRVTSYDQSIATKDAVPRAIIWSFDFVLLSGYVFIYLMIHNLLSKKRVDLVADLLLYTVIAVMLGASFLKGARLELVSYPIFGVVTYYILWNRKYSWRKKISMKFIIVCVLLLLVVLLLFSLSRAIVGRRWTADFLTYITLYIGCPIQALDVFLQNPLPKSAIYGKETFFGIINSIGNWFDVPDFRYNGHLEYRYSNGVRIGNVFTGFRPYINDFSLPGLIVLTTLQSVVTTSFYLMLKKPISGYRSLSVDFGVLLYSFMSPALVLFFYFNRFFSKFISFAFVREVCFLFIVVCVLSVCENYRKNKEKCV